MVRVPATRTLENVLRRLGFNRVCGVDEVGRGCLAGPGEHGNLGRAQARAGAQAQAALRAIAAAPMNELIGFHGRVVGDCCRGAVPSHSFDRHDRVRASR